MASASPKAMENTTRIIGGKWRELHGIATKPTSVKYCQCKSVTHNAIEWIMSAMTGKIWYPGLSAAVLLVPWLI